MCGVAACPRGEDGGGEGLACEGRANRGLAAGGWLVTGRGGQVARDVGESGVVM